MNKQKKCLLIINSTAKLDFKKSEFLVQSFLLLQMRLIYKLNLDLKNMIYVNLDVNIKK